MKDSGKGDTIQHVFATIRAKSEANGYSIPVDFSSKGFYSSYTPHRLSLTP